MLSLRRGTIARRLKVLTELTRTKVWNREYVRDKARALAAIEAAVTEAGLDANGNDGLRYYRGADRELARLDDTPALQAADAAFIADDRELAGRESYAAQVAAEVLRWAGRPPPSRSAAPFDWYAWSLAFLARPHLA